MKSIYSTIAAISAVTLTLAGPAAAQDRSALVTSVDVMRLVANGQPADQAQLREHFAALADVYEAQAQRDSRVMPAVGGNPNHPIAVPPAPYYTRRVDQSRTSAATLRALAAYHGERAVGRSASLPSGAESFERGEGAPDPTEGQIRELVASARTSADHRALETYFTRQADLDTARAEDHSSKAQMYRLQVNDRGGVQSVLALHCEHQATLARTAANEAHDAADREHQAAARG